MKQTTTRPASQTGRGGAGRGQGRKKLPEQAAFVGIRMSEAQKAKMHSLGGAQWVREKIDKAKEP
jgi:hypothetical protein